MENMEILVKGSGGNVMKCPGGVIHVNISGVSLHLNELEFINLSRMMQEASSGLVNDVLRDLSDGVPAD